MSGERQTVAGAYLKIAAHEELCAERYRGINEKLSWVLRSLVGMLLALLAWALVQLYALEPLRRGASLQNRSAVQGHAVLAHAAANSGAVSNSACTDPSRIS